MNMLLRRIAPLALAAAAAWTGMQILESFSSERVGRELATISQPGDIQLLSSTTCAYCAQARDWLTTHKVPFGECFIETDAACAAAYRKLQAPGTPMVLVRGRAQVGFSAERIVQALRRG